MMGIKDNFRKAQQPEEQQSYDPETVANALSSGDDLIGLHFDQLALLIQNNAGVAQETGQAERKTAYLSFIDQLQKLKAEFAAKFPKEQ